MVSIYEEIMELEKELENCFDTETGEIDIVKENLFLSQIEERIESGIEFLCKSRANKINAAEGIKAEETRLNNKRKSIESRLDRIDNYILSLLEKSEKQKLEAGSFTVTTRKYVRVMLDNDFSNKKYQIKETIIKTDKKKIGEDLKNNIKIKGASLQECKNLVVK